MGGHTSARQAILLDGYWSSLYASWLTAGHTIDGEAVQDLIDFCLLVRRPEVALQQVSRPG